MIYNKYVKEWSALEINISWVRRVELKKFFTFGRIENDTENQMTDLVIGESESQGISPYIFDGAVAEVWQLLMSAFGRRTKR